LTSKNRAGLLYLAYTPVDTLAVPVQKQMARDLALAGLVAEDVYGLGELLSHPVAQTLRQDADNAWLLELVNAFNSGKIAEWGTLKARHAGHIQQHASVAQHLDLLEQKIRILALIELVWSRPADGRNLSFKDIAAAAHLPVDSVELLVMRALALGLIKVSQPEKNNLCVSLFFFFFPGSD
jgi:26S proteasome regulatory subunit N9